MATAAAVGEVVTEVAKVAEVMVDEGRLVERVGQLHTCASVVV